MVITMKKNHSNNKWWHHSNSNDSKMKMPVVDMQSSRCQLWKHPLQHHRQKRLTFLSSRTTSA
jgi:hypothetical protein